MQLIIIAFLALILLSLLANSLVSAILCILFGVIAIGYTHNKTITQFIDGFI